MTDTFTDIVLIGRPAAGKSEILHHLRSAPADERKGRFHIADMLEIDDFPMLWTWFEEDRILAEMGKPRLHTDEAGYFAHDYLWDVLIKRIELEHRKFRAEVDDGVDIPTIFLEFSRGLEHGGFRRAFDALSSKLLQRVVVVYIEVSFPESLRKNRRRFNPERAHSILEHGLPDEKLERLYGESDWQDLASEDPSWLTLRGVRVPYVVFPNEDDVTTKGGPELSRRLEEVLGRLWETASQRH